MQIKEVLIYYRYNYPQHTTKEYHVNTHFPWEDIVILSIRGQGERGTIRGRRRRKWPSERRQKGKTQPANTKGLNLMVVKSNLQRHTCNIHSTSDYIIIYCSTKIFSVLYPNEVGKEPRYLSVFK